MMGHPNQHPDYTEHATTCPSCRAVYQAGTLHECRVRELQGYDFAPRNRLLRTLLGLVLSGCVSVASLWWLVS